MIDFETALAQLLDGCECRLKSRRLPLAAAANRILAQPLYAQYPAPMFDNSAMDGYAVCSTDGSLREFAVVGRVQAGDAAAVPLKEGEAVRIFTGAPLPGNTTAVVMQEQAEAEGGRLKVKAEIKAGQNMRLKAEEIQVGQELLAAGCKLDAAALGLAASQGFAEVEVYEPLKVLVFSTGNELAEPGRPLSDGLIYDANRYQLLAWLQSLGMEVADGGIIPDDLAQTEALLKDAAQRFDAVITSGGASVGEADYLKQAVENVGVLTTRSIAIKPGKPFGWGRVGTAAVFVLPGNPVAAFVTAHMLLAPALGKLSGRSGTAPYLPQITAKAAFGTRKAIKRREFLRVVLSRDGQGETIAELLPNQGSAMLATCARAEALCEVSAMEVVNEGDTVRLHLLPR